MNWRDGAKGFLLRFVESDWQVNGLGNCDLGTYIYC